METLLQAALAFFFTIVLGTRVAHAWQSRAAKETRFFEASRDIYQQMSAASEKLISLAGRRIYASQRLCLMSASSGDFPEALQQYKAAVLEWNNSLMSVELSIKTLFKDSYISSFEYIQKDLAIISNKISKLISGSNEYSRTEILIDLGSIRSQYFAFAQNMITESRLLHRQMHFGVKVSYNFQEITKMSNKDLIKALFFSPVEHDAVVRSPSDFGRPVSVDNARFGIYE